MHLNRTLVLTLITILSFFTAHCRHISRNSHRGTVMVQRQLTNANSNRLLTSSKNRFEGDILVRKTSEGSQESAVFQDRIWPDGKIPYQISNDYNQGEKSMILNAMNEIHAKTCVRFSPRTTERHFIDISKANSGCSSYVGRQGGSQELSLEDECFNPRIVKHELMHAIGFYHEQSRTDRDDYVVVHFDNVNFGLDANFQKYDSTQVQSLRTPYDIKSIMHYAWNAFARDTSRPTITAKNGGARIEPSNDFTETDILDINRLYNCNQGGGGNKGDVSEPFSYISVTNGGPWGIWGNKEFGRTWKAIGFSLKVEPEQGAGLLMDDTALNAVAILFIQNGNPRQVLRTTSLQERFGDWGPLYKCPGKENYLVSFRLKVEVPQGDGESKDDTAANDVEFKCTNGEVISSTNGGKWGSWGAWSPTCSTGFCGIQTKVELLLGANGDDTALNDVRFMCGC